MTMEEAVKVFEGRSYDEARKILRDEIKRLGRSTSANDSKLQLIQKAVDGNPMIDAVKDITVDTKRGKGEVPETKEMKPSEAKSEDTKDANPVPDSDVFDFKDKAPSPSTEADSTVPAKAEPKEDDIAKAIREAEAEAKRLEEEAKRQREAADKRKKELEDLKRKAEEERKRKEKEEEEKRKTKKHYKSNELIETLKVCGQAYLVGPAGTGKSTLAMNACEVMFKVDRADPEKFSKVFAQISFSPDTTKGEMIGMTDINGEFHESEIVRVFRDGGVILFDEIDNADASMLVKLNTALANGFIATPKGQVKRSANTYIICTANTFGTGPDAMYVGRTRLDAATLDRFVLSTIEVDYDKRLEDTIMNPLSLENRQWLSQFVTKVRKVIKTNRFRRLCSTRFVIDASKFLANGKDAKFVEDRFLTSWSDNEKNAVRAA